MNTAPFEAGEAILVTGYKDQVAGTVERCEPYRSAAGTDEFWVFFEAHGDIDNVSRVYRSGPNTYTNSRQVTAA